MTVNFRANPALSFGLKYSPAASRMVRFAGNDDQVQKSGEQQEKKLKTLFDQQYEARKGDIHNLFESIVLGEGTTGYRAKHFLNDMPTATESEHDRLTMNDLKGGFLGFGGEYSREEKQNIENTVKAAEKLGLVKSWKGGVGWMFTFYNLTPFGVHVLQKYLAPKE